MPEVEYITTKQGLVFWRVKGANNRVLAVAPQAYADARGARRSFSHMLRALRPMVNALGDS